MIVRYWQPLQEADNVRRQLDTLFDEFNAAPKAAATWAPAVNVIDNGDGYLIEAVVPGLTADDIAIEASRKSITISGEYAAPETDENQRVLVRERRYGTFRRAVTLPTTVDHENVSADYANGVLTLRVPKSPEVLNQVVKVSVNGASAQA